MKSETDDIRDRLHVSGDEVAGLNFIRAGGRYQFRKHHRQGMRSHIFEVLESDDVVREKRGVSSGGVVHYPRATPRYMLRILRKRFTNLGQTLEEINRYNLVLRYLSPELIAISSEFIVDYSGTGNSEIMLCGLQEYIPGAILDPWGLVTDAPLQNFYRTRFPDMEPDTIPTLRARQSIATFVRLMHGMISESGYITDLAGNGNLMLSSDGEIKLVDINNIIKVSWDQTIPLDDKGYPSCDKSIEVLAILEEKILQTKNVSDIPLYRHFLTEDRRERVRVLEERFFQKLSESRSIL